MGRKIIRPDLEGGFTVAGTEIVDGSGNIKAPVSTTNLTTTGNTTIGDAGTDTLTVNAKMANLHYWNLTGYTDKTVKAHNHDSTSTVNAEFKYDTAITSGATYGVWSDNNIGATGTASATAVLGVATVESGVTATGTTLIGTYGQARADGTVAGSSFMTGLYGLIEASAAITASHVCSAWLDTHQAEAVTGSYQLLYMTENGATALDQVMYVRAPKAVAFAEFDTCSAFVSDTAETAGAAKKIKITIDGTPYYINAYAGS